MKRKKLKTVQKMLALAVSAAMVFTLPSPACAATAERENPKNPTHRCNRHAPEEYSYIYFGSYPQSRVGSTEEIRNACQATGVGEVDGEKYSKCGTYDEAEDGSFTHYVTEYFKWEPIKWRVLEKNDENGTLLVMADTGIDYRASYVANDQYPELREWLNQSFYKQAFDEEEQSAIQPHSIDYYNTATNQEYAAMEKIFFPSLEEVTNPLYGFCKNENMPSASRRMNVSDYALAKAVTSNGQWWLRSKDVESGYEMTVNPSGSVNRGSFGSDHIFICVPALYLNLSSDTWTAADGGAGSIKNPAHDCPDNATDTTEFDYVYFGSYPQSQVEVPEGDELPEKFYDAEYDKNRDAWIDGTKYRKITSTKIFKWERIRWRVLENDGDTLLVMADKGLDYQYYDNYTSDTIDWTYEEYRFPRWKDCTLRKWLNGDFYGAAFDKDEQNAIVAHSYPFSSNSDTDTDKHKISLLSLNEVQNPAYGFCRDGYESESRQVQASDFARAQSRTSSSHFDYCLRSNKRQKVSCVSADGSFYGQTYFSRSRHMVVPILRINLSSDLWLSADDGTSGSGGNGGFAEEGNGNGTNNGSQGGSAGNGASGSGSGPSSGNAAGKEPSPNNGQTPSPKPETSAAKPPATSVSGKIKAKSKSFVIKWKKQKSVSGYQIQYSTSKKFSKKTTKTKTVKKASTTSLTVKKLKAKKTYYVRVRTYKTANGRQVVSKWSKTMRVKTKK